MIKRLPIVKTLRCALAGMALTCFCPAVLAQPPPPPDRPVSEGVPQPAGEEEDILAPRGPVKIPVPEKFPWGLWGSVAGGVAPAWLLFWWWRRRKGKNIEVAPAERAMTRLAAVDSNRNTLEPDVLAERSADVVRTFVSERFSIAAPQRTTEEFLREVAANASSPLAPHSPLLREFLKSCDMAKFAGAGFDAAGRLALLDTARRFVRASNTPAPVPPPLPPAQSEVPS